MAKNASISELWSVAEDKFHFLGECKIVCVKGLYKSTSVLAY